MIKFIKKYKLTIISFLILIIWGVTQILSCKNDSFLSTDPLIMYYHLFIDKNLNFIEILGPLFVIIPSIYEFHSDLSSGFIKNKLARIKYRKYLINNYFKSISKIWILPVFAIILTIMCCIYFKNFNFGSGSEYYGYLMGTPDPKYANNILIFIIVYVINLTLHSIFYVHLGLLYCKKYSSYLVNIILSFLTYIFVDILAEIFIGNLLLAKILNIHNMTDSLNLFNVWIMHDVVSLPFCIIYSLVLVISTFIILCFLYKNKEGVIIETEK